MRAIGAAERALELCSAAASSGVAFGKPLIDLGGNRERVADLRDRHRPGAAARRCTPRGSSIGRRPARRDRDLGDQGRRAERAAAAWSTRRSRSTAAPACPHDTPLAALFAASRAAHRRRAGRGASDADRARRSCKRAVEPPTARSDRAPSGRQAPGESSVRPSTPGSSTVPTASTAFRESTNSPAARRTGPTASSIRITICPAPAAVRRQGEVGARHGARIRDPTCPRAALSDVPEMVAYCDDVAVAGTEFYVMRRIDGVLPRPGCRAGSSSPPERAPAPWPSLDRSPLDLHRVEPARRGSTSGGGSGLRAPADRGLERALREARTWNVPSSGTSWRGCAHAYRTMSRRSSFTTTGASTT